MYFLIPNGLPDLLLSITQLIWALVVFFILLLIFIPFIILAKFAKTFQIIDGKLNFNANKEHQKYSEVSKENVVNENQMKSNSLSSEISTIE
jgi:predicted Holliday junction resolvase-like endonuclease